MNSKFGQNAGEISTIDNLIKDNDFISNLVTTLKAGADDQGIYTKKGVNEELAKKAHSADLTNKVNVDGSNATDAGVTAMLNKLPANEKVAKVSDLTTKVNVAGDNATDAGITAMLNKLPANEKVAKVSDLTTKVNVAGDNATDAGVTAMLGKLTGNNIVAKVDGSNATDAGITAMLNKLPANEKVAKVSDLTTKVNVDGANATDAGVAAMLGKLNDKVVKTSQLGTKDVAEKVLAAQDGNKSVLVEKLGTFLDKNANADKVYGGSNNQSAKEFLADKYPFAKIDASNLTDAANQKAFAEKILRVKDGNDLVLAKEVTNKDVVKAIFSTKENAADAQSILAKEVANKDVAGAVLGAKDGQKLVLVEKLGGFLDATDTVYGASGNKTAKIFLAEKGMKPSPQDVVTTLIDPANRQTLADAIAKSTGLKADLAKSLELRSGVKDNLISDQNFKTDITIDVNASNQGFQGAVREVISQPVFEIPTSDDAALNWAW